MNSNSWVKFFLFFVFFLYLVDNQAQTITKSYSFNWFDPISYTFPDGQSASCLFFENAIFTQENPTLPSFYEKLSVEKKFTNFSYRVLSQEYTDLPSDKSSLIPDYFLSDTLNIEVLPVCDREKRYVQISFIPIVRTAQGKYKLLKSISLEIVGSEFDFVRTKRGYASQSVLATGQWYNFSVSETGIYKVTHSDLLAMGMSDPINSQQIAVFGNGGRMLPEANSAQRIDDLQEIPIMLHDGDDGKFDEGDYFLFYGLSPHTVSYNQETQRFSHTFNVYSTASTYFVTQTVGKGEKKRVQTVDNSNLQANRTVEDFNFFDFYETDLLNMCESGKDWFGDRFDVTLSRDYNFKLPSVPVGGGRITVRAASTATVMSHLTVSANQVQIGNVALTAPTSTTIARITSGTLPLSISSNNLRVNLSYSKPTASATSYLDWIEIEFPCRIAILDGQTQFRNVSSVGDGNITKFVLSGVSQSAVVWDVTNPSEIVRISLQNDGQNNYFNAQTTDLREFVVFDGSKYKSVTPLNAVANQNLHATEGVDMVIVAHPDFMSQANRLAQFRMENDNLSVKVVTPQQIYNEFSSGSQDPIAIRDYVKMIYDKTGKNYPKYLLLFGRPNYDYRGIVQGTSIYVPNYQYYASNGVISEYYLYSNDDNFGLLDDEEGFNASGLIDIGIGRIPCANQSQAATAVDKSIRYTERRNLVAENSSQISNLGDWRNVMAFVADDENANDFIFHADTFSKIVARQNVNINFDKMYLDAYQQVSNAGGQRYPSAVADINNRMNRGALVYTYIGHSGKDGWAAERVLEATDIQKWTNKFNMPILLSLSCTFAYYDRDVLSPSDMIYFNNKGGAAAVIAASREAWSSPNNNFGINIFSLIFDKDDEQNVSVGNLNRKAKNKYGGSKINLAMFVVLGDPSMRLPIPQYKVVTDSINHFSPNDKTDTIRALSKVTVAGHIEDANNNILTDFNGSIFPSIYDKELLTKTLANDPESEQFEFKTQKSVLFRGNSSVKNGYFNFSFYVPKDIDYTFGNGKISYYAHNNTEDAAGAFTDFLIGGTDTAGMKDDEKPKIELYLNDFDFVDGGITNPDPVLIARISDNFGINTTGNGIGHDLIAVLDNATNNKIILNDYYKTEKDSFNCGIVRYNLQDLQPGDHTLTLRAWDINNNSAEQTLSFRVSNDNRLELSHVLNYPNPFTTHTDFYFEHNQSSDNFDIKIQIYTISGKLVKTIFDNQYIEGSRSKPISWDGLDDFGDKVAKGTYLYRITVKNSENIFAQVIEKLVIL